MDPVTQTLSGGTTLVLGAGFAVQRVLEIFDVVLVRWIKAPEWKRFWSAVIATVLGWLIALFGDLSVLYASASTGPRWLDVVITGLAIGAGTEGVNSLLKNAQYSKEAKKDALKPAETAASILPPPTADAALHSALGGR